MNIPACDMTSPRRRCPETGLQSIISSFIRFLLVSKASTVIPAGTSSTWDESSALAQVMSGPHWIRSAVKPWELRYSQKVGRKTTLVSSSKPTVAPTVTRQFRFKNLEGSGILGRSSRFEEK